MPAILVAEGLLCYTAPEPVADVSAGTGTAYAADVPELETVEQSEKKMLKPQGTAGKLAAVKDPGSYKDGTYTGSAKGFGGTITVSVTIKKGKIASIKILSASGETGSFLSKARAVTGRIVDKQSTNVDAVSGATCTSSALIEMIHRVLSGEGTVTESAG